MATAKQPKGIEASVDRFKQSLDRLITPEVKLGLAVSGGPDSLAMLLLAADARPSQVEAATVDHALRPESRAEAQTVRQLCQRLGIPHQILTASWDKLPATAIQERARAKRYALLGEWARERGIGALLTAHHVDDQAETFLMRLARGAGVKGLAGMRPTRQANGGALVRPLLGWRRSELEAVCAAHDVEAVLDPSNDDEQFERVRIRKVLAKANWLDPAAIARSANNLAQADAALHWATTLEWKRGVNKANGGLTYKPSDAPREIRRRIIRRAVLALATEAGATEPRGREIDQLLAVLVSGGRATLRGVLCTGGPQWRFTSAPARKS